MKKKKNLAGFASYLAYFFQRPTKNPTRGSAGGSPGEVGSKGSPDNFRRDIIAT